MNFYISGSRPLFRLIVGIKRDKIRIDASDCNIFGVSVNEITERSGKVVACVGFNTQLKDYWI